MSTVDAETAARTAGVVIRELTELADLDAVYRLYNDIWQPDPNNPPVTTELLRALAKAGNYVSGAFDGYHLVGACVAFFGPPAEATMHSHVAGVSVKGRSVGYALKLHQRAWAIQRGLRTIAWTFDPLVSRNAYFNLVKLGATVTEYLPNFYGGMQDRINAGDESDRLLVTWDLTGAPANDLGQQGTIALARSEDGLPVLGSLAAQTLLVAVPQDIESLRAADPSAAKEWRAAVRDVLGTLMAEGARVTGYDKSGWFVVTRGDR